MTGKTQSITIVLAIISLVAGLYLQFFANSIPVEDQQQCQRIVQETYDHNPDMVKELINKCTTESGFVAMMTTKDKHSAQTVARNIAQTNQGSILVNALSLFLLGFGSVVLLVTGIKTMAKKK